jgi:hypothetical protein
MYASISRKRRCLAVRASFGRRFITLAYFFDGFVGARAPVQLCALCCGRSSAPSRCRALFNFPHLAADTATSPLLEKSAEMMRVRRVMHNDCTPVGKMRKRKVVVGREFSECARPPSHSGTKFPPSRGTENGNSESAFDIQYNPCPLAHCLFTPHRIMPCLVRPANSSTELIASTGSRSTFKLSILATTCQRRTS